MKKLNKLLLIICSFMLIQIFGVMVSADSVTVAETSRKGSISVHVTDMYTKEPVQGGKVALYKVATIEVVDGVEEYVCTDLFKDWYAKYGLDIQDPDTADGMNSYTTMKQDNGLASQVIDKNGNVSFKDLEEGVYLLCQKTYSDSGSMMQSFIVTIPMTIDGETVYDIEASPKTDRAVKPDSTDDDDGEPKPDDTKKLPQTGQLWWPVPLLAIAGMLSVAIGWKRRNSD